jgi:hypothetical protein
LLLAFAGFLAGFLTAFAGTFAAALASLHLLCYWTLRLGLADLAIGFFTAFAGAAFLGATLDAGFDLTATAFLAGLWLCLSERLSLLAPWQRLCFLLGRPFSWQGVWTCLLLKYFSRVSRFS